MNQQVNEDLSHLKILSICFYVKAGLTAMTALFFSIYIFIGAFFMTADIPRKAGDPPPELFGGIFVGFGIVLMLVFFALAFLAFWAGRSLSNHKNYTFCIVIAALVCLSMPLGTILGIFTIIVLMRDSVKAIFNGQNAPQFGNTPPDWK
ncbi:MAG TPA: hypothetical protein VNB22_17615 [Pyrinomonadaceae bacterium]|jgi:hypothetical protein|nr:hypothetical protein [Pyrinomonadaceae bacterium]